MKRRRLNGKKRHKKTQHKLDHNEPDRRQQRKQTEEAGAIHAHSSSLKSGSKVINHNQFAAKQPSQSRYKLIRAFAARLQFWLQNELQRHCQDCEDTFFFKAASSRLFSCHLCYRYMYMYSPTAFHISPAIRKRGDKTGRIICKRHSGHTRTAMVHFLWC